ncbi:MAG: response regulator [Candidatus Aminicenantes bacterium]|nr:response regulator [Candidatus Aminicenantes bacterium]
MDVKKILFVDDEQFVLDGLSRLLREYRHRWELRLALNGKEALGIVNNETIDMIISDVRMPEMNGLDLLERLQADEKTKNIPVVILTGDQERSLKRQALDLGAVDLLNKPINKEDLVSRIDNVLKLKEYQDIIIEKKRALEEQLVISQKMELVGVMAAGAVHDLSNLIAVIIGYSNLFIEGSSLDKEEALSMERIRRAGEKASDVVGHILKFSRLDDKLSTVNIGDLVDEMLSILEVTVPKAVKIHWKKPRENIYLGGSAIKYQQVVMNLFVNALQAMEPLGKGKLNVSLQKLPQEGAEGAEGRGRPLLRIEVEDTGTGMDNETMDKIFNPLFTTKEPGKGTGLGLFVVKYIIDQYGGNIEVLSELGKGSIFRVYFPLEEGV